jgi:chaperonin cofactor prefoldin
MSSESLTAAFVDARGVLQSLHDTLETRAEWRQLSDDLVRQTHQDELTQLQQRADQARTQLHALESQWPTIEKSLDARRATLQQRREQTEWRCNALNDATVELKSELAQLDMEDLLRSAREKSWLDKRDISTLPASVHQRIVMFLESHDLAQMLRVCLPWARALDHGYVWQAFLARDTLAARRTKVLHRCFFALFFQ